MRKDVLYVTQYIDTLKKMGILAFKCIWGREDAGMNNEKLKWFETHIYEYLNITIYDPDSLTAYLPEDKWYQVNPTRGIRQGEACYDLTKNGNTTLARI